MNQHVAIFRHLVNIRPSKYLRRGYNIKVMVRRKGFKLIELSTFKYFSRYFFGTSKSETFIWAISSGQQNLRIFVWCGNDSLKKKSAKET